MFRRQTDQVYEMLQQVQRRMSQGDSASSLGNDQPQDRHPNIPSHESTTPFWRRSVQAPPGGAPVPGSAVPGPPAAASTTRGFSQATDPHAVSTAQPPVAAPAGYGPAPSQRLAVSIPVAFILMLLWVLTLLVAYYVGRQHQSDGAWPNIGFASGDAGNREPPAVVEVPQPTATAPGTTPDAGVPELISDGPADVLVLKSVRTFDSDIFANWQREAANLNQVARDNPGQDLAPLFGVRRPRSGGLQLVYGYRDGRFGVDRARYAAQAALLRGLPEYKDATWINLQ